MVFRKISKKEIQEVKKDFLHVKKTEVFPVIWPVSSVSNVCIKFVVPLLSCSYASRYISRSRNRFSSVIPISFSRYPSRDP